jgi:hypothetical protein
MVLQTLQMKASVTHSIDDEPVVVNRNGFVGEQLT